MVIKAIFMDFDGTVNDAREIAEESLLRTLDEFGFRYNKRKALSLLGNKMHVILSELGVPIGHDLQRFRRRFYFYFTGAARDGRVSPCVSLSPLWELSRKFPLFVISNSETSFLKASIDTLGVNGLFSRVLGAEKFSKKDVLLRKLFRKMKIKPSEAMYIGDRFSDIDFARDAGCVAVAIHNKCSWSSLARIKREKPDYIIKDFRDLNKLVLKLNK